MTKIIDATLIRVSGSSHLNIGNITATELPFSYQDITNGTIKTASTRQFGESIASSLIEDLRFKISVGGLSLLSPDAISRELAGILGTVATPLDGVLYNLLSALGVRVGEADIRVHGVRCQQSVLVQ
ncbi:hypothetical protein [Roseibium sp.]